MAKDDDSAFVTVRDVRAEFCAASITNKELKKDLP